MAEYILDDREKIELFLSCRKLKDLDVLSKSDPFIKVFLTYHGVTKTLGQTEILKNNLNPDFAKTFIIEFIFEAKQILKFEVITLQNFLKLFLDTLDKDDYIGSTEASVARFVGSKNQVINVTILPIKSKDKERGQLIVKIDKVKTSNLEIFWQWQALQLRKIPLFCWSTNNPSLWISKMLPGQDNWAKVYETEIAQHTLNPLWKSFKISRAKLGDDGQKFKVECIHNSSSGSKDVIGSCTTTLEMIKEENTRTLHLVSQSNKASGTLQISQFNITEKPGFLDYIKGGTQLNLMIAVDFTASNGDPKQQTSLHYLNPNAYNQYQSALYEVSEILLYYDYDKNIPMFGFGAKLANSTQPTHCFPMTFNTQNCEVQGLQGIMQAYAYSLSNVRLSGPTYFGEIMEQAKKFAIQQQPYNNYTILLILTDGEIHDMDKTLGILASCSNLPISVIIIGVGDEKFEKMQILDGDDGLNSNGKQCRDLVFNDYKGDAPRLAEEVLKELPQQLVEYMMNMGLHPKPPQVVNMQNL